MSLKDDALAFLAAIWTSPLDLSAPSQNNREYQSQQAALHHAVAFLLAHHSTQNWVDFQTILPLVLYALESPSRGVREAAMECVVMMDKLCEAEKPVVIYGFDTIYGENSGQFYVCFALTYALTLCRYMVQGSCNTLNGPICADIFGL
jgi:U3 small nucleolar RNA-associated protein 10